MRRDYGVYGHFRKNPQTMGYAAAVVAGLIALGTAAVKVTDTAIKKSDKCKTQCFWNHAFSKKKRQKCKCKCAALYGSSYSKINCCSKYNIHTPQNPCPGGEYYFNPQAQETTVKKINPLIPLAGIGLALSTLT